MALTITSDDVQYILSSVSQLFQESKSHVAEHGSVVGGSWTATTDASQVENGVVASTFTAVVGKTAAIIGQQGDSSDPDYGALHRLDVASTAVGDQYAPRGARSSADAYTERVVMIPTETSRIGMFIHGDDDTDATLKPGERCIRHFNNQGACDVSIHWRNDGVSTGDGLGSLPIIAGALLSVLTTNGYGVTVTDSTGAVVVAGNTVQMAGSGTTSGNAVVRKSDDQTNFANFKAAMVTAGVTNASAIVVPTAVASTKTFAG